MWRECMNPGLNASFVPVITCYGSFSEQSYKHVASFILVLLALQKLYCRPFELGCRLKMLKDKANYALCFDVNKSHDNKIKANF